MALSGPQPARLGPEGSCAVPGIWPPVTINGRRYIDGGVGSATHADLAAGYDRILVIVPGEPGQPGPFDQLDGEIERLKPGLTHVIYADAATIDAFGTNPLSRPPGRLPRRPAGPSGRPTPRRSPPSGGRA